MLRSSYLEQVLVVLPLEEHDAVLEEEHVQVDRLEALRLAQLHRQLAVVDQAVLAQVEVLAKGKKNRWLYQKGIGQKETRSGRNPASPSKMCADVIT